MNNMNTLKSKLFKNGNRHGDESVQTAGSNRSTLDKSYTTTSTTPSLEAFKNHWKQAVDVMIKYDKNRILSLDGVTSVVACFDSMCDILVTEREENKQQGPCLVYLLSEDILGHLVTWCMSVEVYNEKIKYELLRRLDHLISHSSQPLLYHKPVIKSLVAILSSCDGVQDQNIQHAVISLLHQLCVCISSNPQIVTEEYMELFFNVSEFANPDNFLIFCMLIPYIHCEGSLGQQTRDALLLIMAASSRNEIIGRYIANRSDFCPVLATGLSALYSTLPRKIRPERHEEWYRIEIDQYLDSAAIQSIVNCLEFCNAVTQVAHDLVVEELIKFIYHGFLVPVMAPALLQNSIEEQISAISYLELFVRTVTEPTLLRAFLYFILTTEHENVALLDWLIERISSSTKLCMVSLSLFKTLVDLNCEDIMYALCFRYLFRLTHVMQSQRRAITELDIYGRVAHMFLQLEPRCCRTELTSDQQQQLVSFSDGFVNMDIPDILSNIPFNLGFGQKVLSSIFSGPTSRPDTKSEDGDRLSIKKFKSDYHEYLQDSNISISNCYTKTLMWTYPWDGVNPPINAAISTIRTPLIDSLLYQSPVVPEDDVALLDVEDDDEPLILVNEDNTLPLQSNLFHQSISQQPNSSNLLIDISISDTPELSTTQSVNPVLALNNTSTTNTQSKPTVEPDSAVTVKSKSLTAGNIESFYEYLDSNSDKITHGNFSEEEYIRDLENASKRIEEIAQQAVTLTTTATGIETNSISGNDLESQVCTTSVKGRTQSLIRGQSPEITSPTEQISHLERVDSYDNTPNIGPFLNTLLNKVEGMMNNSYSVNLLLTSLITRLACYPQPLLRSFLLNQHLVFQPTVKSLIQVIGAVKQKVDHHANNTPDFPVLLMQARKLLIEDEEIYLDVQSGTERRTSRSDSMLSSDLNTKSPARRLANFFSPKKVQSKQPRRMPELVNEGGSYRFTNVKAEKVGNESPQSRLAKINTKKAVYTALVLEEFVKELSALTQEHLIHSTACDEGYTSSS